MDRGISLQVSDGSKERVSRGWRTHSKSICRLPARYSNEGFLTITIGMGPHNVSEKH